MLWWAVHFFCGRDEHSTVELLPLRKHTASLLALLKWKRDTKLLLVLDRAAEVRDVKEATPHDTAAAVVETREHAMVAGQWLWRELWCCPLLPWEPPVEEA